MFAIRHDISNPIFGGYKEPASAMFIALSDLLSLDRTHQKFRLNQAE